jgi:hypothetical protein
MSELAFILLALLGGIGLGLAFFGSLSWMTQKINKFHHPILTIMTHFFLRVSISVFCFVWLIRTAPLKYAGIFLAGFLTVQICFLLRKIKTREGL